MERVMDKHSEELIAELREQYPSKLIKEYGLDISDDCYGLTPYVILIDGTRFDLLTYEIDNLAERFPDCDVGY